MSKFSAESDKLLSTFLEVISTQSHHRMLSICRRFLYINLTCNVQAAEKALRAAHLSQDRNGMPSYQTTDLLQLSIGLADADLSTTLRQLSSLLRDADYLRYPHRHTSPLVPHDDIDDATMQSAIQLTARLLELCRQFIDRQ